MFTYRLLTATRALPAHLVAIAVVLSGCAGFGGVTPGVVISSSEVAIQRKDDGTLATYESDLAQGELTLSVLSSDVEVADGEILSAGFNFTYQAPTHYRARQVKPSGSLPTRVQGYYTYATANFYEEFKDQTLSWIAQRIVQGVGIGRFQIDGEVDFYPGPPTTIIDKHTENAYVYYLALETKRLAGVENLFFRAAMGTHFAEDADLEYTISGFAFTFGYLFGPPVH